VGLSARAAARLVLGLSGRASVSAAMHNSLHWLSYPEQITCKLCLLTYNCLQGRTPVYLSRLCVHCRLPLSQIVLGSVRLTTTSFSSLSQTVTFGPRAFSTSGPDAWNTLSSELRH